jgi:hypothetical protein
VPDRPPAAAFYAHMMEGETVTLRGMPEHARKLLGEYERPEVPGLAHAPQLSQVPLLVEELVSQSDMFPVGCSTVTYNSSTCAAVIPGASCSTKSRP